MLHVIVIHNMVEVLARAVRSKVLPVDGTVAVEVVGHGRDDDAPARVDLLQSPVLLLDDFRVEGVGVDVLRDAGGESSGSL